MEKKNNAKVYINPNYKPIQTSNTVPMHQHNTIHFNQNFAKNAGKIFVNPNFIKTNVHNALNTNLTVFQPNSGQDANRHNWHQTPEDSFAYKTRYETILQADIQKQSTVLPVKVINKTNDNAVNKSRYSLIRTVQPLKSEIINHEQSIRSDNHHPLTEGKTYNLPSPLVKSRYQLIRRTETNITNCMPSPPPHHEVSKMKINKYKIVSLNSVQKNNVTLTPYKKSKYNMLSKYIFLPRSKISHKKITIQHSLNNSLLRSSSIKSIVTSTKYRNVNQLKQQYRSTIENIKGKSKINNIPCPLFTKYGKCLRNIKGKCEYLHDKKHVSLCRKFLKGICHDNNCCLSHEMSTKKMPTCYFYLKGMCFKENCPYLHVKLSDKVKVCRDFVQGYCEKGENCLLRHVKPQVRQKVLNSDTSTMKRIILVKKTLRKEKLRGSSNKADSDERSTTNTNEAVVESRYYKKVNAEEEANCDLIKPTRCKLGTLPSFIQL